MYTLRVHGNLEVHLHSLALNSSYTQQEGIDIKHLIVGFVFNHFSMWLNTKPRA